MGEDEVTAFLTDLATRRQVSASTQNQALSALLFLYRHIIGRDLGRLPAARARRKRKLPVVLSRAEVRRLLDQLHGVHRLIATLLYGSGLRLMEGLRLRVKDLDFDYEQNTVRDGKRAKDRPGAAGEAAERVCVLGRPPEADGLPSAGHWAKRRAASRVTASGTVGPEATCAGSSPGTSETTRETTRAGAAAAAVFGDHLDRLRAALTGNGRPANRAGRRAATALCGEPRSATVY